MSQWFFPKKEDINISVDGEDIDIYYDSDYSGAIYISIKKKDIIELLKNSEK